VSKYLCAYKQKKKQTERSGG